MGRHLFIHPLAQGFPQQHMVASQTNLSQTDLNKVLLLVMLPLDCWHMSPGIQQSGGFMVVREDEAG